MPPNGVAADAAPSYGLPPGMSEALIELLSQYRPGEQGVCLVAPTMVPVLPLPYWAEAGHGVGDPTGTIAIGSSALVTLYTCPRGERVLLCSAAVRRLTGDNTLSTLRVTYPSDYATGDGAIYLADMVTAGPYIFWPPDLTAVNIAAGPAPILLEPGAQIILQPSGAGAATSTFNFQFALRRTRLHQAMAPFN